MTDNTHKEANGQSWKRMSFKKNKVWAAMKPDGKFLVKNNKILIKYNLKQDYKYWIRKDNLKPETDAVQRKKSRTKTDVKPKAVAKKEKSSSSDKEALNQNYKEPGNSHDRTNDTSNPENTIIIYTDGASSGNPGPAGIGALLVFGEHKKEISEFIGTATNNVAELTAIKRALSELKKRDLPVRLFTDSTYCTGLLSKGWKPKKNSDLIDSIKNLILEFKDLKILKIKGHAGIQGNEKADSLATSAITRHKQHQE